MEKMTITEFSEIIHREFLKLYEVSDYLNEAGLARMNAFREVNQALSFCKDLRDLYDWDYYKALCARPGEHDEYYRVMKMIDRKLEKEVVPHCESVISDLVKERLTEDV